MRIDDPATVNVDEKVASGFGDEWTRLDQSTLGTEEKQRIFNDYFHIFPWTSLPTNSVGADFGCGSGRWASVVASRVGKLYCVDASQAALAVARKNLAAFTNCTFVEASIGNLNLPDNSLDFGYSLGVLHHLPDTLAGIISCVAKLRPGAPFLLYLYYRLDQRPGWFRTLWRISDLLRHIISRLPYGARYVVSQIAAAVIYWPLAKTAAILQMLSFRVDGYPLAYYRDKSFYVMRTDALDRFGTRLEQRFSKPEIAAMMGAAGLTNISFAEHPPFWCAIGTKTST